MIAYLSPTFGIMTTVVFSNSLLEAKELAVTFPLSIKNLVHFGKSSPVDCSKISFTNKLHL